ncbi:hypothetical protein Tco_0606825 [Tanacetum coccineum]
MATLEFCDKHKMVAYLEKPDGNTDFHQIIDFLTSTTASINVNGEVELTASIDRQAKTITEASLRRHMKLKDNGGITSLPNIEIFEQLALMGGYSGEDIPLFPSMITAPDTSPSIITSSPSLSPQHTPVSALSPSPPPITETSPPANESALIPYESPLQSVHSLGRDKGSVSLNELMDLVTQLTDKVGSLENELKNTKKVYGTAISKLVKRVKKLEKQVKIGKASRRTKIVLSEDDAIEEDSSKQGKSLIEELDMDADISLVPPHAEIQEKIRDETEVSTADTELKTADIPISTANETPEVSTAAESLVYIRRSEKKKKDKGKAIIIEDESVPKKSKKQEQEERLGHEEAVRLHKQIDEEERKRIARDAEIAKQLQEEYDKAGKKEDNAHVIDWNDPSVIRYHALQKRHRSEAEVRKNMMDQIHSFVPMDSKEEVPRLKRAGQDVEAKHAKRQRTEDVLESVQEQTDEEPKTDELSQEQLNQLVIIVQDEGMNVEALQTKYPIIRWEVYSDDTMQFWKIIRVGNHTEIYQVFEDMLKNFDRDDLDKLWSLVQERYNSSGLTEDKEIELWVELKMLFEPDAENFLELQKYMHDILNWWLYDTCAVHHVSTKKGQDIFMLVEKDYPLTKGLATLMLVNKLRVDQHSEMADELLTKIYNIANIPRN